MPKLFDDEVLVRNAKMVSFSGKEVIKLELSDPVSFTPMSLTLTY